MYVSSMCHLLATSLLRELKRFSNSGEYRITYR